MNDLISVIVPVYNSSLYLSSCINSVLQQTFPYFELILVDDGSQDESKYICEKASRTDDRIRFIHQKHKGVSVARNRGIRAAKGNYLFFLDSDDMVHPYLFEVLYTILNKNQSIMAATEYHFINDESLSALITKELPPPAQYFSDYIYLNNQIALDMFVQGYTNLLYGTGGIMICRRYTQTLFFDEKITNGEDTKFIYQMLLQRADVIILNKDWYYYRKYENTSSKTRTVETCQSMYKCESYIRDAELKKGRIVNSVKREQILLNRMCEWYITGKQRHDTQLCNYMKKTAAKEYASKHFQQISLCNKIKFSLAFYCLPLYWLYNIFSIIIVTILYYIKTKYRF